MCAEGGAEAYLGIWVGKLVTCKGSAPMDFGLLKGGDCEGHVGTTSWQRLWFVQRLLQEPQTLWNCSQRASSQGPQSSGIETGQAGEAVGTRAAGGMALDQIWTQKFAAEGRWGTQAGWPLEGDASGECVCLTV